MIRFWLAVALLAVAWLPGLAWFGPAATWTWLGPILLGSLLLAGVPLRMPARREAIAAVALLVPVAALMPGPYRLIPLLAVAGLVLAARLGQRAAAVARGLMAAAAVLLAQAVTLLIYADSTARAHELPWPLPSLLGQLATLLGADVAVEGSTLVVSAFGAVQRIAATWELLFDPATAAFLAGGLALLAVNPTTGEKGRWRRAAVGLLAAVLVAVPIRSALVLGLLVQRAWRADPAVPLNGSDFLFCPGLYLGLLAIPVLFAWRWGPAGTAEPTASEPAPAGLGWRALLLVAGGVALGVFWGLWEPVGQSKAGRVLVVERHSHWEPTTTPYDTRHYGESASYTYSAIYDYCGHFFTMARLMPDEAIDDQRLKGCDVLLVKTPTAPYGNEEVAAILRFVARGGGLLLIGEHTDVFKSSTYLNQIARPLGFRFRADLLFQMGSTYVQHVEPPAVPHPVVAQVPPMDLAVSCSIAPGWSWGRSILQNAGLWSLPPDYATDNYFPEAQARSDAQYGSFIQYWATRYGRGRVLAWTDSTIFSSFCAFEPGRSELMLGMLQWLNHHSVWDDPRWRWLLGGLLGMLAAVAVGVGLRRAVREGAPWMSLMAAALLGATLAATAAAALARQSMPLPPARPPLVHVVVDRTLSEVPLAQGGFTHRDGQGYGLAEQWIPRLGYIAQRRGNGESFGGDALLVLCPTRPVSPEYRRRLVEYVKAGGRLLVLDSPDNLSTTAAQLLEPFGLSLGAAAPAGTLHTAAAWPALPSEAAWSVEGGTPILWSGPTAVAARACVGRGTVIVVGCGKLFNDTGMGRHWMAVPDAPTQTRFDLWYGLLRAAVEDRPLGP